MALVRASEEKTSSNSSSRRGGYRYHVFLSFRGGDTRKAFTDHLYTALNNSGFLTFRDDDELERGEDIKQGLPKAIKQSRTSVIVFSKDYASSRWCLDELVMILEQKKMTSGDHVVLPVFYDVDPSDVRKQTGSFGKAFAGHRKTQPLKTVKKWREALAEVADLAGMVLQNGYESKFIKKIVNVIGGKLSRTPLSVAPYMIGMHSRVESINRWLEDGSTGVDILVIYGMGGIGKTTIAKYAYNSNFGRFEGSSFIENIRDISQQPNGLVELQRQLLSDVLKGRKVNIHSVSDGLSKIEDSIGCKKVLLVLDDLDHTDQLEAVLRMKDQFHSGSKIIITTRHARLLSAHQVTKVHEVRMLNDDESLELFSRHAFGQDKPIEGYMEYSEKVVQKAGGLPLALKVLGRSLSGVSIDVWKSALEKLEAIPNHEIMKKLRISYDSLDDYDQNLFLHIACFLVGREQDYIVRILDGCHLFTIVGIQNLIDRCLVTLDKFNFNKVNVHDTLRDMGREIARQESKEPEKRTRLCHHKDSLTVLREKNGTPKIEGLVLHMQPNSPTNERVFGINAFAPLQKLMLLHLSHVELEGCSAAFPRGLIWLCWLKFPLDSIPTDFHLESLIVLEMQHSSLRRVFEGTKCFPSLMILDLSHSHGVTGTLNFSFCPYLEKLILVDCRSLVDVHESIGCLERLVYFNMQDCINLRTLPQNMVMLKSLETFILSCCSSLDESSIVMMRNMESLKVLAIDGIPIRELSPGRSILNYLPCSIVDLNLNGCNLSDDAFPTDSRILSSVRRLNLGSNPISSLPDFIKGLKKLADLDFDKCTMLRSLVGLPKLDFLSVGDCISLEKITFQEACWSPFCVVGINPNLDECGKAYKLEPIERVDVEIINLLGLCNLESLPVIRMCRLHLGLLSDRWTPVYRPITLPEEQWSPVKGLYENGIFSTFFAGSEVPGEFSHKSDPLSPRSPISFTVPLLLNRRIRGLNVFAVYAQPHNYQWNYGLAIPMITKVRNKTKGPQWIYGPSFFGISGKGGEDMIWLSHWKMENVFEAGDEVVVSVVAGLTSGFLVKEFGAQLVHEQQEDNMMSSISNDPCYPYVIGVDLPFYDNWTGSTYTEIQYLLGVIAPFQIDSYPCDYIEDEEEGRDPGAVSFAETAAGSNNGGLRGWKALICWLCLSFCNCSLYSLREE